MIHRSGGNWKVIDCTKDALVEDYRGVSLTISKQKNFRTLRKDAWTERCSPYMYGTYKSKCHDCETCLSSSGAGQGIPCVDHRLTAGRVCKRDGHSCLRRICSFFDLPSRQYFRCLDRAVDLFVRCMKAGVEVASLSSSAAVAIAGLNQLDMESCRCFRCNCRKPKFSVVATDAAQFYEALPPHEIMRCLHLLVGRAVVMGYCGICVSKGTKAKCFLSRSAHCDARCLRFRSWSELICGMSAALKF